MKYWILAIVVLVLAIAAMNEFFWLAYNLGVRNTTLAAACERQYGGELVQTSDRTQISERHPFYKTFECRVLLK